MKVNQSLRVSIQWSSIDQLFPVAMLVQSRGQARCVSGLIATSQSSSEKESSLNLPSYGRRITRNRVLNSFLVWARQLVSLSSDVVSPQPLVTPRQPHCSSACESWRRRLLLPQLSLCQSVASTS